MQEHPERPAHVPATFKTRDGKFWSFRHAWTYRDASCATVGLVARFEVDGAKQVVPYFKRNGSGWKAGGPQSAVLFGVDRLNGADVVFVTEGEPKAAALHSLGFAAVTTQGGSKKAASGDWPALAGVRRVVVLPDHDPPGEAYARDVARLLVKMDPAPELAVARLPGLPEKGDVVDWLAARLPGWDRLSPVPAGERDRLATEFRQVLEQATQPVPADWLKPEPEPEPEAAKPAGGARYVATRSGMVQIKSGRDGIEQIPLANFTARIVEERVLDDGAESRVIVSLEGARDGRTLPRIQVNVDEFHGLSWVARQWGTDCVIEPGSTKKDVLRAAIQTVSHAGGAVGRRTVYAHTGWRQIDGRWMYLHGGGAIDADGAAQGVEVDLGELSRYTLPTPSATPAARKEAAAASLAFLDVAPWSVTLPLLAAVYLATLAERLRVDLAIWLEAPSQEGKSSLSAVALAHYGAEQDRTRLTGSFLDTANALEGKLFTLMDALAVIDDYAPQSNAAQQAALDATATRLIRSCGNRQGRSRLRSDLSQRPDRYPRGLVIGTAEQWPNGESINGRLFGVTLERRAMDWARLTACQATAERGLLARCMADFLKDLADGFEVKVKSWRGTWLENRAAALTNNLSGRLAEQVAFLLVGAELAFGHFKRCGLTLPDDCQPVTIFTDLARQQERRVSETQPADKFRHALADLLASGAVHLAPVNQDGSSSHSPVPLRGTAIGWRNDAKRELYLLKAPSLEAVNETLRKGSSGLNIQPAALWRQLQQRGWLLPGDEIRKDGKATGRRNDRSVWLCEKSERVLVFDANMLADS